MNKNPSSIKASGCFLFYDNRKEIYQREAMNFSNEKHLQFLTTLYILHFLGAKMYARKK